MGASLEERFWERVDTDGPIPKHRPDLGPCWIWIGYIQKNGYGKLTVGRKPQRCWAAHRLSWFLANDEEPPMDLDHLCRNKRCVNPSHLEPVTVAENGRRSWQDPSRGRAVPNRKPVCRNGHEFTPENSYWPPHSHLRQCRACRRESLLRHRAKRLSDSCDDAR